MKRILLLASILFLALPIAARAQTPVAIEGLQVIAERQYAFEDANATIDTSSESAFLVSARVYQFEEAEQAESTWETLVAAESIEADLPDGDDSVQLERTELEDVGDRAMILNLSAEVEGGDTGVFRTVIVQSGAIIITVTAIAGSSDAADIATDFATAMAEREPGAGEASFDERGGSTGAIWDVFLPADAEELQGFVAYADKETRLS